jgi:hypothetical protein
VAAYGDSAAQVRASIADARQNGKTPRFFYGQNFKRKSSGFLSVRPSLANVKKY